MKSDVDLHKDVAEALALDEGVHERGIAVAVNGGVVTLTGSVTSYPQKLAAEKAVRRICGVHGIAEELTVDPPADHRRDDADLVTCALDALRWNPDVPADAVLVTVERGWLKLTGTVERQHQREAARLAVASLAGIRGVSNGISLRRRVFEGDIAAQIHDLFERDAAFDANQIQVETFDGTVTLRGSVHSWTEREDAATAAYSVRGVVDVNNLTTVGSLSAPPIEPAQEQE